MRHSPGSGIVSTGLNRYAVFGPHGAGLLPTINVPDEASRPWEFLCESMNVLLAQHIPFARSSHDTPSATHDRRHAGPESCAEYPRILPAASHSVRRFFQEIPRASWP